MPITGDHNLHAGGPRSTRAVTTISVAPAANGPAALETPSGTCPRVSNTIGMTVAAISMITVPDTTGVNIRRNRERRAASRNWNSDEMTTKLAMVAGPAPIRAATHTAMKAPDVPMMRMCPDPMRPTRTACRTVVMPLTTRAAKAAHDR